MPRGIKPPEGTRWCTICRAFKPKIEFFAWPNALCKPHYREYDNQRAAQYRREHPGWDSARVMAWAATHPKRVRAAQKRYAQKLVASGRGRLKYRRWVEKNPKAARQRWRNNYQKRYAKDPAYFYHRAVQRRARRLAAPGQFSRQDATRILQRFRGRCLYCHEKAQTLDHITPLIGGGTNYPWNIGPACRNCNAKKGTLPPLQFIATRILRRAAKQYVLNAVRRHDEWKQTDESKTDRGL